MKGTHFCLTTVIVVLCFITASTSGFTCQVTGEAFPARTAPMGQNPDWADEQADRENKKLVMNLKFDVNRINMLRLNGSIVSQIPNNYRDRIGAIRIKQANSFLTKPFVVQPKSEQRERILYVEIDNTILERLPYQPVELKIYDSGFDAVKLQFNPWGIAAGNLPKEVLVQPGPNDSPILYIRTNDESGIYGMIEGFNKLKVNAEFGIVSVPVNEIAGIRFNVGPKNEAYIVLKKGDAFSGSLAIDNITVSSRWGKRKINIADLQAITTMEINKFVPIKNKPNRWKLQSTLPQVAPNIQPFNPGTLTLPSVR